MRLIRTLFALAVVVATISPSAVNAQSQAPLLDVWYTALFDVNRVAIADLLSEEARFELKDLGVTQSKAEFIAALDEWEEIAGTANFAWQLDPEATLDASQATALVCYQFPDNELLIREAFGFRDGKIVSSVQSTIGDSCEAF